MSTAATVTRDEGLWVEEVARVLATAPTMTPAARAMVETVLASFVSDPGMDAADRRDARAMLAALRHTPPAGRPLTRLAHATRGAASLALGRGPHRARDGLAGLPA